MKLRLLTISVVALAGCATSTPIALPGGGHGFAIECPHPGQCYNKAAEVCAPRSYELVDKGMMVEGGFTGAGQYSSGAFGSKTTLVVRCNAK